MSWFNYYGLIIIAVIMIPNILCGIFDKSAFENRFHNKAVEVLEQMGRYGCFGLMIFNIPYTYIGFWFENAFTVYLLINGVLLALYCFGWVIFCKTKSALKQLWLSIIPTATFLFSGIMIFSVPLIVAAVLFGIGHITISYANRFSKDIIGIKKFPRR